MTAFQRRYPGVEAHMVDAEPPQSLAALEAGELDLAIAFDYDTAPLALADGVRRLDLISDPMLVALPARHPLAYAPGLRLGDLAADTWISARNAHCRTALAAAARQAGFTATIGYETDDYAAAKAFVGAGAGVALVPHLATARISADIVLRPLRRELPTRRISALWLAGQKTSTVTAMLDTLRELRPPAPPAHPASLAGSLERHRHR